MLPGAGSGGAAVVAVGTGSAPPAIPTACVSTRDVPSVDVGTAAANRPSVTVRSAWGPGAWYDAVPEVTAAIETGNDDDVLPTVPATSPVRGRSYGCINPPTSGT